MYLHQEDRRDGPWGVVETWLMASSYLPDSPHNQPPFMGCLHGYQAYPPVWAMLQRVNPKPGTVWDAHEGLVGLLRETKPPLAQEHFHCCLPAHLFPPRACHPSQV